MRKLPLTLEEMYSGCEKKVVIERSIVDGASRRALALKEVYLVLVPVAVTDGAQLVYPGMSHTGCARVPTLCERACVQNMPVWALQYARCTHYLQAWGTKRRSASAQATSFSSSVKSHTPCFAAVAMTCCTRCARVHVSADVKMAVLGRDRGTGRWGV